MESSGHSGDPHHAGGRRRVDSGLPLTVSERSRNHVHTCALRAAASSPAPLLSPLPVTPRPRSTPPRRPAMTHHSTRLTSSAPPTCTATSSTGTTTRTPSTTTPPTTTSASPRSQTLIKAQRERSGSSPLLVLDAGDTIQGTPLAYYYAKIEPITAGGMHPMANAMNLIGYDAAALGNHEFNYGIPLLRTFESQLDFPLLGANAVDPATKLPVFTPYIIQKFRMPQGPDLKVGILGLTNPGIAIWDKANVSGQDGRSPASSSRRGSACPKLKKQGCDIVVIAAHSGADTSSSYGDALPYPENASSLVAAAGARTSTRSWSATPTSTSRSASSPTSRPASGVLLCEPRLLGHASGSDGARPRTSPSDGGGSSGRRSQTLNANTVERMPRSRRRAGAAPEGRRLRQLTDRYVDRRSSRPPARPSRTCRSSTSSTTSRPTR